MLAGTCQLTASARWWKAALIGFDRQNQLPLSSK
jgi:hypothetical protein